MYSRTYLHRSCTSSHTSNNFNMVWAMHHTISLQLFLCPRIKLYIVRYIAMLCVYCHNISISNQILIEYTYEIIAKMLMITVFIAQIILKLGQDLEKRTIEIHVTCIRRYEKRRMSLN